MSENNNLSACSKRQTIEELREQAILELNNSTDRTDAEIANSDALYNLGLTCYSGRHSIESSIYNAIATSVLDESISLHPQQLAFIQEMIDRNALIFSAPTSFGKTFCLFEYLARAKPNKVILVVPTLALVKEYLESITSKYSECFKDYKVRLYASPDEHELWQREEKTILILTHEKVISAGQSLNFGSIDFFAIDEVYKLDAKNNDSRTLTMNVAFLELAKISKKYVLLAPFIAGVRNIDQLPGHPEFLSTNFQPVVNKVSEIVIPNSDEQTRYSYAAKLLNSKDFCKGKKTLVFFPTPTDIRSFLLSPVNKDRTFFLSENVQQFVDWCEREVSPNWSLAIALKKGFLLHTGQIFTSIRNFETDLFDDPEEGFLALLCTSTLLEGVNTPAEKLILTFPSRSKTVDKKENYFSAFEFFNLVGRTGRLFKHLVGEAYYLKTNAQPSFDKTQANEYIEFEATTNSDDLKIQMSSGSLPEEVNDLLSKANITEDEYRSRVGPSMRIKDFKDLLKHYNNHKQNLHDSIKRIALNDYDRREQWCGLQSLIQEICVIGGKSCRTGLSPQDGGRLITLYLTNPRISTAEILEKAKIPEDRIDKFADVALKLRTGMIENSFMQIAKSVLLLMEKNDFTEDELKIFSEKVIGQTASRFFMESPQKHMILELGVYDSDVENVCKIIGDDFADIFELKERLKNYRFELLPHVSFLTRLTLKKLLS